MTIYTKIQVVSTYKKEALPLCQVKINPSRIRPKRLTVQLHLTSIYHETAVVSMTIYAENASKEYKKADIPNSVLSESVSASRGLTDEISANTDNISHLYALVKDNICFWILREVFKSPRLIILHTCDKISL